MNLIEFAQSFVTFRIDIEKRPPTTVSHKPPYSVNNARIQLECQLNVIEKKTGELQSFVLGASCKTERVGVEQDLWLQPNADFAPIFSADRFLTIKTYSTAGITVDAYPSGTQPERQLGNNSDAFDELRIEVAEAPARLVQQPDEVVSATLHSIPINGRTTLENDRYLAVLEYPIKTMNANERDQVYQSDTGPVIFPDLSVEPEQLLERLELAYCAFNSPDWIEFILRVPTPVADGVSVYHYQKPTRCDARNEILMASRYLG